MRPFLPQLRSSLRPDRILPLRSARPPHRTVSSGTNMSVKRTPWVPHLYPTARRADHFDVYKSKTIGEVRVHDPYVWLERNTEETEAWTTAQEACTRKYLDQNPDRQNLEDDIRKNMNYAKVHIPPTTMSSRPSSTTISSSSPLLVCVTMDDGTGITTVVFNPNPVSGTYTLDNSSCLIYQSISNLSFERQYTSSVIHGGRLRRRSIFRRKCLYIKAIWL